MSVVQMQRINIYALKKHRKGVLEELQRKGVVQVEDLNISDSVFKKEETSQKQALFLKNSSIAENAAKILNDYLPVKKSPLSMFEGRSPISVDNYYMFTEDANEIMRVAYEIIALEKDIADNKAEIIRLESQIESLAPWKDFDMSMRFAGTASTVSFVGVIPSEMTYEEIVTALAESSPDLSGYSLEIISSAQNQTCVFLICSRIRQNELFDGLRQIGFSKPAVLSKEVPAQRIEILKRRISESEKRIQTDIKNIKSFSGVKNALSFISDYYIMRADKYRVIERLSNTKHTFALTGYVPKPASASLEKLLASKYNCSVELETPDESENIPIELNNNGFVSPVESVLETYSLPGKREVDPTFIMAIFYYVFFGMMFSDAGYGLVMTLGCALALLKFKNMEHGLKKSIKMFMYCGISTMFWGFMFGSFFGDAVTVIGKTFFNADISIPPIWFNPIEGSNSMTLLMVCFLFGIIHLFVGLGIKAFMLIRDRKYLDAVYDVLSWYLLVGGGIIALLSMDTLKTMTGFVLPSVFLTVGGICAAVGALIIVVFEGRGSSPIKRFLKGLYGLYGVTGYLSDILSYSRLLALGLATGVIAQVFNQIGSMFGGGFGAIPFAIVFIAGHTLNIGINALGAYVHTNRLQFVEFFGKFYEGGGEKFAPFKINTKHYKIKEEIFNG